MTSFFISCNPILDRIAQIVTRCFPRAEKHELVIDRFIEHDDDLKVIASGSESHVIAVLEANARDVQSSTHQRAHDFDN